MFNTPWDGIRNLGSTAAVLAVIVGAVWYFATLENRVRSIEAQLQQIRTAPSVSNAQSYGAATTLPNPIQDACAKLASDYASSARGVLEGGATRAIKELMEKLNCFKLDK